MAGNLIIPRVEVLWGDTNLTSYNKEGEFPRGEPLVFRVEAALESMNQGPTGSMMWSPTGPAFKVYEDLVTKQVDETIVTRFFYANGKSISFRWIWSGQVFTYGNQQTIRISLQTELAGEVNGTKRSMSTFYKGSSNALGHTSKTISGKFNLSPGIQGHSRAAQKALEKANIETQYSKEATFGATLTTAANAAGTFITVANWNAKEKPQLIHMVPYSSTNEKILDAYTLPPQTDPSRTERYGFILGPSIINTIQRSYTWVPPQQTRTHSPSTAVKPVPQSKEKTSTKATPKPVQNNQSSNDAPTAAPVGPSGATANPGIRSTDNPDGPDLQQQVQEESTARLGLSTLMLPILTGIKPNDIVFIPNFEGDFIEDWIVQSVSYSQTDGGVEVSINGSRIYGSKKSMNQAASDQFLELAKKYNLVGEKGTLEAWDNYAWSIGTNTNSTADQGSSAAQKAAAEKQAQDEFNSSRTANIA